MSFQFQRFTIHQSRCAMKVGTDGVLLGAWASLPQQGRVLDIGAGTGLLSLMVAQRTDCLVTGIEIDADAAAQAAENAAASSWAERIAIVEGDIRTYAPGVLFDTILSNPPYYDGNLLPPDAARARARHTSSLTFAELVRAASRLLSPHGGTLQVVLPAEQEEHFLTAAAASGLYPARRALVYTRRTKPPRRLLLSLSTINGRTEEEEILLQNDDGTRSEQFQSLTRDFYL